MTTKLLMILKSAKKITISPAVLKKIPAFGLSLILNELKLMSARAGRVPRANAVIVRAPLINVPVERV